MSGYRCVVALNAVLLACSACAAVFEDGPQGATCDYYSAAARLEWQHPGGDWEDARAVAQGHEAFDSVTVPGGPGLRTLSWDVSAVARMWLEGREPIGALLLMAQPGRNGTVALRSREHPEPATRPALVVEWDDGEVERLDASADTYFACPTHRSLGEETTLKVATGQNALLVFPFRSHAGRGLRKASLVLVSDKAYGTTTEVGVVRPVLPAGAAARLGLAAKYANDAGIEADAAVYFADRFDDGWSPAWKGMTGEGDARVVSEDRANRFEPIDGKALEVTIHAGVNQGLNAHLRFDQVGSAEPEEAWFRYYLRFADNWNPDTDGGKLPGFSGTYGRGGWGMRKSDGHNGWSARGAFFAVPKGAASSGELRGIGSYVYYAGMSGSSGDIWGWSLGPGGLLHKNRWYCVEQHVRLNQVGSADGVLEAWIDGRLVLEKKGLRFRDTAELKIESLWMNVYHGGTQPADRDLSLFIDNVVIARQYIGPVGRGR